jgi:site-specific recombinase XerD
MQRAKIDATIGSLLDAVRAESLQYTTFKSYRDWTRRFSLWLCLRADDEVRRASPAEKIRAFLLHVAAGHDNGRVKSATSLDGARHALLFLYQKVRREEVGDIGLIPVAKRPKLLPDVRTPEEVVRVFAAVEDSPAIPYRLILRLLYYTGGRINDVLRLRLKDINWADSEVVFRCGKGKKDGRGVLPCVVMEELRAQAKRAYGLWQIDRAAGVPAELPVPVYNKAPSYGFSWGWYFLFPAPSAGTNPLLGHRNRWHVDPRYIQRTVKAAAASVGLAGVLTPHKLRHVYATELLRDGVDIRTVQELLRHDDVKTTEVYSHTAIRAPGTRAAIERHALRLSGPAPHVLTP